MDVVERSKFMAEFDPKTLTGDTVRKLLVVMALMEVSEAEKSDKLAEDCEVLLYKIRDNPLAVLDFVPVANELTNRFKELNDGIGIKTI